MAGDAGLPDNLDRVSIQSATAFLACTSDDLANVQACLHARRLNPKITVVARVYDDALAEQITRAFAIDHALSASGAAVSAFVGAATDELALRPVSLEGLTLLAGRYTAEEALSAGTVAGWRAQGVRVLAWRDGFGAIRPPSEMLPTHPAGTEFILCGPADAVRGIIR